MYPWQLITPDLVLSEPIWSLTVELLAKHGIKGLILDVDNTLVRDDESDASPQVKQWIDDMRRHFKIWLVSNNFSDKRIRRIADTLDLPYRSRAIKPSRRAVRSALQAMDLPADRVAMIGDRLFTDTVVGKRLGLLAILVQPPASSGNSKPSLLSWRSKAIRNLEMWFVRKTAGDIATESISPDQT